MNEIRETRSLYERLSTGVKAGALVVLLGIIALATHHNEVTPAEMGATQVSSQAEPSPQVDAHYLPSQMGASAAYGAPSELPPTF